MTGQDTGVPIVIPGALLPTLPPTWLPSPMTSVSIDSP
jgi:hypothetical protein